MGKLDATSEYSLKMDLKNINFQPLHDLVSLINQPMSAGQPSW